MNDTTKRDTPFPNSSSTPVSNQKIYDGPNDPNYWKENIITQEESDIKVPINQPGNLLTEFAERLIALEQENVVLREELEQLKEVVRLKILKNEDGGDIVTPKDESSTTISNILRKYNLSTDEPKDDVAFALQDVKIDEYTLERSKLPKFTAEDFEAAKEAFEASNLVYGIAHELNNQLIETSNAAAREVDTWVLDIFKTLYGCKSFDDVYLKMTHQQYFKEFKRVIELVNERLEYIDNSQAKYERDGDTITYYPLHGYRLCVPQEPIKPSEELYQNLKSLWEEIYHEN